MFTIENNILLHSEIEDHPTLIKELDNCLDPYIIIPPIYHIKTKSGKKINGFAFYLFNEEKNIFLNNNYTFYKTYKNKEESKKLEIEYEKIITKLKSLDLRLCLLWFNINHRNTLNTDFPKIFEILSQKCKNIIKKYNLENLKLRHIIKYETKNNEELSIELYELLYELIVSSDVITTKYIKFDLKS